MTFTDLGLHPALLAAVAKEGYSVPTPIQERAIPAVLTGTDLLAAAQTGTGKTAAFVLPILHRLATVPSHPKRQPRVLVLTPTRELAAQVAESVATYGHGLHLRHAVIFGGVGHQPQVDAFKRGLDIVIATPGRLLEHANDRTADLSHVETFILDEADRMLDMGFIRDIKKVLAVVPKQRQTLLFSATFSDEIRTLANGLLHNPKSVEVARRNTTIEIVEQSMHRVPQAHKRDLLAHLIKHHD
ncbi:MAG: DEAD/DEAH box helicase, partial [Stagnimonas sp.]|nr:DEAD/DEAH box helicase [Stagnimonas sp.]